MSDDIRFPRLPERGGSDERCRAARHVAARAHSAADCARILAMLGLDAAEAKSGPVSVPEVAK